MRNYEDGAIDPGRVGGGGSDFGQVSIIDAAGSP